VELAYVAGLIDGEGYIGIMKHAARPSYSVRVDIGMTDKAEQVLKAVHRQFGGLLHHHESKNSKWRAEMNWQLNGADAAEFLRRVLPFLILKAEQAEVAIALQEMIDEGRAALGRHHWTPERIRQAEILKQRIHDLNSRGPAKPERWIKGATPIAIWRWGAWWDPQDSLFGPVEFTGAFPANGRMRDGKVYAT
jgi:hypothetical protein